MRIAIVTEVFLPAIDGVVVRLRRTLEELDHFGDDVLVVAPAGGPPSYANARVVDAAALRMPLYPDGDGYPEKRVSLPSRSLVSALNRFRPDVIHAVNPMLLAAGAVVYARRNRVPLVASYHAHIPTYAAYYGVGRLEEFGWRYVRALHNRADLNLCTSHATMQTLRERGVERVALWPYGVDPELLRPALASSDWRSRLSGGHPEWPILLFVGRLAKEKNIGRLAAMARKLDGVALAIVGDGPMRRELEREFAGTPTTFLGLLTGGDLVSAYASADLFVFPSQTETLGMVMLEAHAAGLPVIAADSPASRELIRHGVDGYRYDPSDPLSLPQEVGRLIADRGLRRAMALESRRSVAGATWAEATGVLREYYQGITRTTGVGGDSPAVASPAVPVARASSGWRRSR